MRIYIFLLGLSREDHLEDITLMKHESHIKN